MMGSTGCSLVAVSAPGALSLEHGGGHCHGDDRKHDHGLDHIVHDLPPLSAVVQPGIGVGQLQEINKSDFNHQGFCNL